MVPGTEDRLIEDLQWAGLQWDEGPLVGGPHGPYRQSDRNHIYQKHAHELLESGHAYRCFCESQTAGEAKAEYITSGCYQDCASLPTEESNRREREHEAFTVRLKPSQDTKKQVYPDLVYGKIVPLKRSPTAVAATEDETSLTAADTILIKSDRTPTYHFANVVDDHLMGITHVIRGSEWMASTPLHYDLYRAFGWKPPVFAHVGLLVDENKAKLSKRSNTGIALDVKSMRDELGVLPQTLVNFLALLGWSNPTKYDVMDLKTLVEVFDLKFTKGNAMVKTEKLWYLQKQHVAQRCREALALDSRAPIQDVVAKFREEAVRSYGPQLGERFLDPVDIEQYCSDILLSDSKSFQHAAQFVERNCYYFAFDDAKVPPPNEGNYDQAGVSAADVIGISRNLVRSEVFETEDNAVRKGDIAASQQRIVSISDQIHEYLDGAAWRRVLKIPDEEPVGPTDNVAALISDHSGQDVTASDVDNAVLKKKALSGAVMRRLREKLSYGLPGPSVGIVMAILGQEECQRRIFAGDATWMQIRSLSTVSDKGQFPN